MNVQPALSRNLLGKRARRELLDYLGQRLPHMQQPASITRWEQTASSVRARLLKSFFRGHPAGLLRANTQVQWGETIPGDGYRVRKLRYEGYPGMWVPALLYQPDNLRGRVPAILNPNGHHAGGKAMDYKQARCINLARRGMLALSTEFIGMGELRGEIDHNRISLLDLCGVAGVGVFYLVMKRGLDILLRQSHTDPERVAMTGLSGGGWQTAVLSALDERIRAIAPVAGHSPVWQRRHHPGDIGDLEQIPSDLCAITDYDTLTAMFAPRPALLMYNREDSCFPIRRTRTSVYRPAKKVYELLGVGGDLALHDNVDPGTHNYELDNRTQLYGFLNRRFDLDTPDHELDWEDGLLSESQLRVGLPADNATLLSLAQAELRQLQTQRARGKSPGISRTRLAQLIRLARFRKVATRPIGATTRRRDGTLRHHEVSLDETWSLPVTEVAPRRPTGITLVVNDGGRRSCEPAVQAALDAGHRILTVDLLGTGHEAASWHGHMLVASTGERSLGIQVGQLISLLQWIGARYSGDIHLNASGRVMPIVALMAAALRPGLLASLVTSGLLDTLGRLIDWPVPYADAAPLFCFGLLAECDIDDLVRLSRPIPLSEATRGPLGG